ncbi:MAG TPA: hypothetical protein VGK83_04040 [Acidimicrobiia bacterium]
MLTGKVVAGIVGNVVTEGVVPMVGDTGAVVGGAVVGGAVSGLVVVVGVGAAVVVVTAPVVVVLAVVAMFTVAVEHAPAELQIEY